MKKLMLMFAILFMAFSNSFAYDNEVNVSVMSGSGSDFKTAHVNSYTEILFMYSIVPELQPNVPWSGTVYLKNGTTILAGDSIVDNVGNNTGIGYTYNHLGLGWWYSLDLEAYGTNTNSFGILVW